MGDKIDGNANKVAGKATGNAKDAAKDGADAVKKAVD